MPYVIRMREGEHCVFREDKYGETLGCHSSEAAAQRQIAAILAATHTGKASAYALRAMPPALLEGLCSKFGPDEGFFTRCMASDIGKDTLEGTGFPGDPEGFCAWLHKQCQGKWPGEKGGFTMFKNAPLPITVGNLLESRIHEVFTVLADALFQQGYLERDERLELSSAIGDGLDPLHAALEKLGLDARELDAEVAAALTGRELPVPEPKPEPEPEPAPTSPPAPEPGEEEKAVYAGGALKALGGGKVGGYLVQFSPGGDPKDAVGDYFTQDTDLSWTGRETRPALYQHGLDPILKGKRLGDDWHYRRVDDVGLWVETQLRLRDEYEKAIYELIRQGKLGLSSGTATHMIVRENDGRLVNWPIVEGSFTPTPAEPRTRAMPLRSVKAVPLSELIPGTSGRTTVRGARKRRRRGTVSAREVTDKLTEILTRR